MEQEIHLRLEAGLCLYGHDLDKDKTPVEANLKWAISKERISKGDFIGSDIIIKQLNDGVSKIRVGIKPEGELLLEKKQKYLINQMFILEKSQVVHLDQVLMDLLQWVMWKMNFQKKILKYF